MVKIHFAVAVSTQQGKHKMKSRLLTTVACGALANAAHAQSSVTL
jgi:hypothetical protein